MQVVRMGCVTPLLDAWCARNADVARARAFARRVHAEDRRNFTGEPFFFHTERATESLLEDGVVDLDVVKATLVHDAHEDHPDTVSVQEVVEVVGWRAAQIAASVTKPREWKRLPKEEVVRRMFARMRAGPAEAWLTKCADLNDNLRDWPIRALPWGYLKTGERIRDAASVAARGVRVMPAVARRLDDTLAQVRYAKEASEAYRRPKPAGVTSLPEVMGFRRAEEPRKNTMPEWE